MDVGLHGERSRCFSGGSATLLGVCRGPTVLASTLRGGSRDKRHRREGGLGVGRKTGRATEPTLTRLASTLLVGRSVMTPSPHSSLLALPQLARLEHQRWPCSGLVCLSVLEGLPPRFFFMNLRGGTRLGVRRTSSKQQKRATMGDWDAGTKSTVQKIPLLKVRRPVGSSADPRSLARSRRSN